MKKIIRSVSDIITNSSSEVFVMKKEDAGEVALFDKDNETYDCISMHKMELELPIHLMKISIQMKMIGLNL